jgi:hypothetical protein
MAKVDQKPLAAIAFGREWRMDLLSFLSLEEGHSMTVSLFASG